MTKKEPRNFLLKGAPSMYQRSRAQLFPRIKCITASVSEADRPPALALVNERQRDTQTMRLTAFCCGECGKWHMGSDTGKVGVRGRVFGWDRKLWL